MKLSATMSKPHGTKMHRGVAHARLPEGGLCPLCGGKLARVHRDALDRWVSVFRSLHRYRCNAAACGWEGLLGRAKHSAAGHGQVLTWRSRLLWLGLGVTLAFAAVGAARVVPRWLGHRPDAATATLGAGLQSMSTPPGQDFDGAVLPSDDARVVRNPSPLTLRRNCAWGVPGGNPYRGTVEQALQAAQLPPDVVRQISEMAERGWSRGQVEISHTGIRTLDNRREFGTHIRAMGLGNTLCFDTRVNFKPGHVEYASLYQADDKQGKTYSVMVPFVCGNVSLLGERIEEWGTTVPEPGSVALLLLGLGTLVGVTGHLKGRWRE